MAALGSHQLGDDLAACTLDVLALPVKRVVRRIRGPRVEPALAARHSLNLGSVWPWVTRRHRPLHGRAPFTTPTTQEGLDGTNDLDIEICSDH
jgi:hypothetical protein